MKKILLMLPGILLLNACATTPDNGNTTIVDPSYDFVSPSAGNRLKSGTVVEFTLNGFEDGKQTGYITNNIFNVNDNVILFQAGDKISMAYSSNNRSCNIVNVVMSNISGFTLPIVDFYLTKDGEAYNCGNISNKLPNGRYGLTIVSVSNMQVVNGGVAAPDILDGYKNLDTAKQYKIVANRNNLSFVPEFVADNGIQTIIKTNDTTNPPFYINEDKKSIPINYSIHSSLTTGKFLILDGVYADIVFFSTKTAEPYGEVHILRSKVPDSENTSVKLLYRQKQTYYKNPTLTQNPYIQETTKPGTVPQVVAGTLINSDAQAISAAQKQYPQQLSTQSQKLNNTVSPSTGGEASTTVSSLSSSDNNSIPPIQDKSSTNSVNGGVSIMNQLKFNQ